ncbi:serine/threonine-protein phosphatase 6 regulatory ankyrin repeat subunit A-like [Daphnia pulicaria]|uniref:serine/threonine-protein phosphatase 6 regulatory ankyrin repeat subunit A-like n=1 Tax=Daphnia pulicaria TaxID=35523 RepID=UPI001EEB5870|nr:serine/threonine-protein phosphatase 6 regulatory ankyrin repeat subunit A-like [Daphnia pulicaria]
MNYHKPLRAASVLLAVLCLVGSLDIGSAMPRVRDRPSGGEPTDALDQRIGVLLHKISKPIVLESSAEYNVIGVQQKSDKTPVPSELRSDVRAAVFVLRETQLQMLSALSAQIKIQEKLALWAPHMPKTEDRQMENQMANVFQKISSPSSSSSSQGWTKTAGRPNNKVDDMSDNSEALYSAIKEIVVVFQETQFKISSILAVQADIQARLDYWKIQLDRIFVPEVKMAPSSIPPREIPCYADDTQSKSSWLLKAFECHSAKQATFWITSGANWQSKYGNQSALQLAVSQNWTPVVHLLFKRGADCRTQSSSQHEETLLHQAVREDAEVSLFRQLLTNCEVNATDSLQKQTALHIAAELGRKELAVLLIKQGRANVEAQDEMGFRPLHFAIRSPPIVTLLVGMGVDIGATTVTGMTPLHLAVIEKQMATVKILVKAGAKVSNALDIYGHTPLDYAALMSDHEMRALLAPYATVEEYLVGIPSN